MRKRVVREGKQGKGSGKISSLFHPRESVVREESADIIVTSPYTEICFEHTFDPAINATMRDVYANSVICSNADYPKHEEVIPTKAGVKFLPCDENI